jgi:lipopolysaccharide export system permease protein
MMNTIQLMKAIDSFRNDLHTVTEKLDSKVGRMFTVNTKDIALSEVDEPLTPNQDQTNNATNSTTPVAHRTPLSGLQYRDSVINYQLQQTAAQNMLNDTTSQSSENAIQTDTASSTKTVVTRKVVALKNMASGSTNHFSELIDSVDYRNILINATSELTRDRDEILMFNTTKLDNSHLYQKYMLRLNQQYSWALICIVFLFIGAPLGSIIRKGGYGYPLLVAIFFYMIFIISLIYGEKLVNNDSMTGLVAAWLPCIILSPFAAILTYSALRDLKLNTAAILEYYYRYFKKSKA